MTSVCVEIAVGDDPRLLDAVASVAAQSRRPERLLIAASDRTPPTLLTEAAGRAVPVPLSVARFSGGVVSARAGAQRLIDEDLTVFLDSDETAPRDWLRTLIAPIERGEADFAGGPTRPSRPPTNALERYSVALERSIYQDLVPARVTYLPLQNTAWSSAVLRRFGFDPRIPFAEDHDLEIRAHRGGARGIYVPEAWVGHDPATARGYVRWARKRHRYLVAMAMSLVKNGALRERVGERRRWVHPLGVVDSAMRPFALVEGTLRWRRVERVVPTIPAPRPA